VTKIDRKSKSTPELIGSEALADKVDRRASEQLQHPSLEAPSEPAITRYNQATDYLLDRIGMGRTQGNSAVEVMPVPWVLFLVHADSGRTSQGSAS
jgi:hypothetical protein